MYSRLFMIVALLLGALGLAACAGDTITAEEVVERMEAARATTQDMHAVVAIEFTGTERSGSMVIEGWMQKTGQTTADGRPINKLRAVVLEADSPELQNSLLVSDGTTFWLYNPAENRVLTGTADSLGREAATDPLGTGGALQEMIASGLDAVDIEVLGEEAVAERNTWKLKLTPKTETEQQLQLDGIVEATMWVDEERALPLKFDLDASDAGQMQVEVRSIETNTGLSDDLFSFAIPAGAEVVDAAELADRLRPRTTTLDEARTTVNFPLLTPAELPAGATLVEVRTIGETKVIQNYAGNGVAFSLVQSSGDDFGAERQPPPGSSVEEVTVRGQPATLITGTEDQQGSLLSWEENGVQVIIAGTLLAEDALQLAAALE